jgi:hypothetical protein
MCAEQRPESQRLDYKRTLPSTRDPRWQEEFAKDVCAFANTEGGDILYGIREQDARADAVEAITGEAQDAAARRLGQVADALIQPRIVGLQFLHIPVAGGYALVLRVPASFAGPHGYSVNDALRFPLRVRTHTTDMSYEQLRTAFDRRATLRERVRHFREQRVHELMARHTWREMPNAPLLVMHFIPLQAFVGGDLVDVTALYNNYAQFMFDRWSTASRSLHLDGLAVYVPSTANRPCIAYTQVFRSGVLEAVHCVGHEQDGRHVMGSLHIAGLVRESVSKFLREARRLELNGPAVMGAALLHVTDWDFHFSQIDAARADRHHLAQPEAWIERSEAVADAETVWRPMCDLLWQCFNRERCDAFDGEQQR